MAIYMNWDGVPGDVTTQGYEKWIDSGLSNGASGAASGPR